MAREFSMLTKIVIVQWCTGSGFRSPIPPDINKFFGMDIVSVSTGLGTG